MEDLRSVQEKIELLRRDVERLAMPDQMGEIWTRVEWAEVHMGLMRASDVIMRMILRRQINEHEGLE